MSTAAGTSATSSVATVDVMRDASATLASVRGPMTFATAAALVEEAPLKTGDSHCKVDLAGVDVIDSAGLAVLIEWLTIAKQVGCELEFHGVSPRLRQLAELAGVDRHFGGSTAN